jgi:transcriptional regulator with XRE-family HTH domain
LRLRFGHRIRRARIDRSWSLRYVAKEIGITPSYLSDIENDRRLPAEAVIRSLASLLEVDFNRLMSLSGRLGEGTGRYLKEVPAAAALLRQISEKRLGASDLAKLSAFMEDLASRKQPQQGAEPSMRHA